MSVSERPDATSNDVGGGTGAGLVSASAASTCGSGASGEPPSALAAGAVPSAYARTTGRNRPPVGAAFSGPKRTNGSGSLVSRPTSSPSCSGKRSAPSSSRERRSASAVLLSVPAARPTPRSMRPGCSAWSARNVSATLRALWFGSMIPPEPTRIRFVTAATDAITTSGDELARPPALWCSASQYRASPRASAWRARSTLFCRAPAAVVPDGTGERSSTLRAGAEGTTGSSLPRTS